ncbi:MAG: histidine phosphatase family protein [Betaproteobacteria bacterium]
MTTRLILIRHGETAWNAEHRVQGRLDVPLSATGVWQAEQLARVLADEPIDAVVASDLARAWLTAAPLAARLALAAQPHAGLRERSFGIFEGHTLDEVAARWPDHFAGWRARDVAWRMPEGESGTEFIARVLAALHEVVTSHRGATVAVVAHGGVLDAAYRAARGLAWDAPREHVMANAAINRVTATAPPLALAIESWGDVAHLEAARDELLT